MDKVNNSSTDGIPRNRYHGCRRCGDGPQQSDWHGFLHEFMIGGHYRLCSNCIADCLHYMIGHFGDASDESFREFVECSISRNH